jgi:hypothetical protein
VRGAQAAPGMRNQAAERLGARRGAQPGAPRAGLVALVALLAAATAGARAQGLSVQALALGAADAATTRLFTPLAGAPGVYTAHRLPDAIETVAARLRQLDAEPAPGAWVVEPLAPLDAFGSDTPYDRARLARLFGGSRPHVARGSLTIDGCRTSITLISPYPDVMLSALQPGTLAIVYRFGRQLPPPNGC